MPTYAFRCKSCNYEFEEFQNISDSPLTECPSCKKQTVVRNIGGGAGLVFKGSGFYLTDYKKSSSSPATESTTSKKPESKPETKSDAKGNSTTPSTGNSSTPSKD